MTVYWNNQQVLQWTDASSPWLSGKVGFRQCASRHTHWDNLVAYDNSAQVVAYDDFYPYGQVMDGRSYNAGLSDARYKYTEKERDTETGYDYFGARYYDSRVGRWLSVDPLQEKYPGLSPFHYSYDNPVVFADPDGLSVEQMIARFHQVEGAKYVNPGTRKEDRGAKRMQDGSWDKGGFDCCGFAYTLNQADSDSKLRLPVARVADQIDAFKKASSDVGEYIETNDPTKIEAGDYLFMKFGSLHVVVAMTDGSGVIITTMGASSGLEQVVSQAWSRQSLKSKLIGIGRVRRSQGGHGTAEVDAMSLFGRVVTSVSALRPAGFSTPAYSYDPISGEQSYAQPDRFDPRKKE